MSRLVLFIFAGRRENMEVAAPYYDRLLAQFPEAELHLWDLTRRPEDAHYIRWVAGAHEGRVKVMSQFHSGHPIQCINPNNHPRRRGHPACTCMKHKPPYEKPYQWYASQDGADSTIYVKIDDDVLFLETERFDDLIGPLADHPNRVISANVVNNVVCAKYAHNAMVTANHFSVGDPTDWRNDKRWWWLHTRPEFALWEHGAFLSDDAAWMGTNAEPPTYVRTRPGEAVSINCVAFTHATMKRLAAGFAHDNRLGDEGAIDRMLPWICTTFTAAHLTFGPQENALTQEELSTLRKQYKELSARYLS